MIYANCIAFVFFTIRLMMLYLDFLFNSLKEQTTAVKKILKCKSSIKLGTKSCQSKH